MGLFSKLTNVCNICGANIIGIAPFKIADGCICNNCKSKLSPDLKHRESMSAKDIFEHIKAKEANRVLLSRFQPTRILLAPRSDEDSLYGTPIYVDENSGTLIFTDKNDYLHSNADVYDFSSIRSFSFTESVIDKSGYISISVKVYSEICRSIVEHTYEWSVELPFRFRKKPREYAPYRSILAEVQNTQAFFNAIISSYSEQSSYAPVVPPLPTEAIEESVNVNCPNCGAVTTLTGPNACCEYCGLTIENEYYRDDTEEDDQVRYSDDDDTAYQDSQVYTDDYGDGFLDNSFGGNRSNGFGSGFSYSSNNFAPEINVGGNRPNMAASAVKGNVPQTSAPPSLGVRSGGSAVPPPIKSGVKAGPPSLDAALSRTAGKQPIGGMVNGNLTKGAANQVAQGITNNAGNYVGKQAGSYVMKQAGGQVGKTVAVQAGRQVGKGVAVQAGQQIGKNVAIQAGKQVGRRVAVQAGKQVGMQAGKAVVGSAMKTAGKQAGKAVAGAAMKTATKQASKAVAGAAMKSATKSVGKQITKQAGGALLNGLKKML